MSDRADATRIDEIAAQRKRAREWADKEIVLNPEKPSKSPKKSTSRRKSTASAAAALSGTAIEEQSIQLPTVDEQRQRSKEWASSVLGLEIDKPTKPVASRKPSKSPARSRPVKAASSSSSSSSSSAVETLPVVEAKPPRKVSSAKKPTKKEAVVRELVRNAIEAADGIQPRVSPTVAAEPAEFITSDLAEADISGSACAGESFETRYLISIARLFFAQIANKLNCLSCQVFWITLFNLIIYGTWWLVQSGHLIYQLFTSVFFV
jgi:hypothetical protein